MVIKATKKLSNYKTKRKEHKDYKLKFMNGGFSCTDVLPF